MTVRRQREHANYDRDVVYAIIDHQPVCHVGTIVEGVAMVTPTLAHRDAATIYLHGSRLSRTLTSGASAERLSVTFTCLDGIIAARSGFNHSIAYRSAVVLGTSRLLGAEEAAAQLDQLVDRILPGRSAELRRPTPRELLQTSVVALDIEEASAKISAGLPQDDPEDLEDMAWAGLLPIRQVFGPPVPATDGRMGRVQPAVSPAVLALMEGGW